MGHSILKSYLSDAANIMLSSFELDFFSIGYTAFVLATLFYNLYLLHYKKPRELFHCTSSKDASEIISTLNFETRTEGLMFCSLKKNNKIGVNSASDSDFTFIITDSALRSYRPIAGGLIRFIMPWGLWKNFRSEWVTKKRGDVQINEIYYNDKLKRSMIHKVTIVKQKGWVRFLSSIRSLGISLLNFGGLGFIYFRWNLIGLLDSYKYISIPSILILAIIAVFFYFTQGYFNNKVRGR